MKLIIDIPERDYQRIKEYYEKNDIVEETYSYIFHGTPLEDEFEKIKAEIGLYAYQDFEDDWILTMNKVYEVIDNRIDENK